MDEFAFYTPEAKAGVLHIRSLSDQVILLVARDEWWKSPEHAAIKAVVGENTNPFWITGECAEEALKRDLIDTEEFDRIMR